MTIKYRLVKETFPDRVRYSTEKVNIPAGFREPDHLLQWSFVGDSLVIDDEVKARELFERIVIMGTIPRIEVLAEASVE